MEILDILKRELSVVIDRDEIAENDADGLSIKPHHWSWTAYTVYSKGLNRYAVYAAHPNIMRGIDIEDERFLMEGTIFAVQSFFRGALNRPVNQNEFLRVGLKLGQEHD